MSKTLYIVDHAGALARALAGVLASRDLEVEIRASGEDLLATFDAVRAICVLVETHLPGMSAVEIARQLSVRGVAIPIVPIDAHAVVGSSTGGRSSGTVALRERVRKVEKTPSAPMAGPDALPTIEVLRERFQRLTSREREVAGLVAQGYSSKEAARALGLSRSTVDNHRARILEKLQLTNSVQVTRFLSMLLPAPH